MGNEFVITIQDVLYTLIGTLLTGWIVWVSKKTIEHAQGLKDMGVLQQQMQKMDTNISNSFAAMNARMDLFMKTYIDELKNIIRDDRARKEE